ncbi:hydroxyacylglutathione hydrolase [Lelliottia amnigena]|nr:hydroxyacylglutathione hydrolase [Lelliottia amnigena]
MNLISIPAFQDNYIWVLADDKDRCIIVDPGEAAPVMKAIEENGWQPEAILLTHHHNDHVGGVPALREKFPHLEVYGPKETQNKGTTRVVEEGQNVLILEWEFSVFATPGHTSGHICFYSFPYLFVETRCFLAVVDGFSKGRRSKCISLSKRLTHSLKKPSFVALMSIH